MLRSSKDSHQEIKKAHEEFDNDTKLNLDLDKMVNIVTQKNASSSSDDSGFLIKKSKYRNSSMVEPEPEHINFDNLLNKFSSNINTEDIVKESSEDNTISKRSNIELNSDLSIIINEISKIKFSEGSSRKNEINKVVESIKECARTINHSKVAKNTKSICKFAKKFYSLKYNGIKGEFNILGKTIAMTVEGEISGDEYLYLTVDGDDLHGLVFHKENENLIDVSNNYNIILKLKT